MKFVIALFFLSQAAFGKFEFSGERFTFCERTYLEDVRVSTKTKKQFADSIHECPGVGGFSVVSHFQVERSSVEKVLQDMDDFAAGKTGGYSNNLSETSGRIYLTQGKNRAEIEYQSLMPWWMSPSEYHWLGRVDEQSRQFKPKGIVVSYAGWRDGDYEDRERGEFMNAFVVYQFVGSNSGMKPCAVAASTKRGIGSVHQTSAADKVKLAAEGQLKCLSTEAIKTQLALE